MVVVVIGYVLTTPRHWEGGEEEWKAPPPLSTVLSATACLILWALAHNQKWIPEPLYSLGATILNLAQFRFIILGYRVIRPMPIHWKTHDPEFYRVMQRSYKTLRFFYPGILCLSVGVIVHSLYAYCRDLGTLLAIAK